MANIIYKIRENGGVKKVVMKLPPDSEPIIIKVGWHPALCIAVGLLCFIGGVLWAI